MFNFADLFQWNRFVTPSIIKLFYWLVMVTMVLLSFAGMASALVAMRASFLYGLFLLVASLFLLLMGVIFARIAAEFVLIVFRINEHLSAIRSRGGM